MRTQSLTVPGGRIRRVGARLEFSRSWRLSDRAQLAAVWLGTLIWTFGAVWLGDRLSGLSLLLLLFPAWCQTFVLWLSDRALRTALEWSSMAGPRRRLVIDLAETTDFRHAPAFVVTLDDRSLAPTNRRTLFESRQVLPSTYVLVVGDYAITVATRERSYRHGRSGVLLLDALLSALEIGEGPVEADEGDGGESAVAGATSLAALQKRAMWAWVVGVIASWSWQAWLMLRVSTGTPLVPQTIAEAILVSCLFTIPPAGLFAAFVKWGLVPTLNARAARLIARTR